MSSTVFARGVYSRPSTLSDGVQSYHERDGGGAPNMGGGISAMSSVGTRSLSRPGKAVRTRSANPLKDGVAPTSKKRRPHAPSDSRARTCASATSRTSTQERCALGSLGKPPLTKAATEPGQRRTRSRVLCG